MVHMKDFPSCFGESGVQITDSSSTNRHTAQNLVSCVYRYDQADLGISGFITVTWIRYLMGQGLTIAIETSNKGCLCKVDIKTWLFSKRKGTKAIVMDSQTQVEIHWDLSSAKFGSSPEPLSRFYLAISIDQQLCLIIGDSYKKNVDSSPIPPKAVFLVRKEHIFGKRVYSSKARFCDKGQLHDIRIENDTNERNDQCLMIYIDDEMALQVPRLKWKFRGNHIILVDGVSVEVYWDVYGWIFGNVMDNAVFLFRARLAPENLWIHDGLSSQGCKDSHSQGQGYGFSLILCAWKNE